MHTPRTLSRAGVRSLALLAFALAAAPLARAQSAPPPAPKLWKGSALANASVFFGNNQQQVLGSDIKLARADSNLAVLGELQAQYGEAAVDTNPRTVTKRLWLGAVTANYRPLQVISGFVTLAFQSNLEKRIAQRYDLGAGAKWNILHRDSTQAALSLAIAGEHTVPIDSSAHFADKQLARLSWVGTFHHKFDDRMDITHSTSWQPSASGPFQYVIASDTQLQYKMNTTIALSLEFTDNYDSGALTRGARTYNDGEMLFGVAAGW